jgi:hypothetical protein
VNVCHCAEPAEDAPDDLPSRSSSAALKKTFSGNRLPEIDRDNEDGNFQVTTAIGNEFGE